MTEEQSGKLVDCVDYLINEIRRLRVEIAEGHHPSLAERIEDYTKRRSCTHEPVHAYISRHINGYGSSAEFIGGAAIAEYAMRMEELLIELLDDQHLGPRFKELIRERMGWK